jgi:hypothetical protein
MHLRLNPIKAANQQAQVLSSRQQRKRRKRRKSLNDQDKIPLSEWRSEELSGHLYLVALIALLALTELLLSGEKMAVVTLPGGD